MPRPNAAALTAALASLSADEIAKLPESVRAVLSAAAPTDDKTSLADKVKQIHAAVTTDDAKDLKAEAEAEDEDEAAAKTVKAEAEDEDEAVGDKSKVYEAEDEAEAEAEANYEDADAPQEQTPKWAQALIGMVQKLLEVFQSPVADSEDSASDSGDLAKKKGSEPVMRAQADAPGAVSAARRAARAARKGGNALVAAAKPDAAADAILLALKAREAQDSKKRDADKAVAWAESELGDRNVGDLDEFRETVRAHYASGGQPAVKRLVTTVKTLVPALPGETAHEHASAREEDEPELAAYAHDGKSLEVAREVLRDWRARPVHYRSQTLQSWLDSEPELEGKARKTVRG